MSASAPGPPPRAGADRPLRGIPRSRAFWDLKAEQMMNRIFDPEEPIDLPVEVAEDPPQQPASHPTAAAAAPEATPAAPGSAAPPPPPPRAAASRPRAASRRPPVPAAVSPRRPDDRLLLIGALCAVCTVSVAGSLLYFRYWNRLQQSLSQERNLLLVERLRSLGPATPTPVPAPEPSAPTLPAPAAPASAQADPGAEGLPPPPPEEPWIEQLSSLPSPSPTPSRVLTVPVSPRLAAAAASPAASRPAPPRPVAPLPQLVGVVGSAGRPPSAIFLVNGSSMSVSSGELIGSTGWRLRTAEGETALIERGGEVRQVSIISGNGF